MHLLAFVVLIWFLIYLALSPVLVFFPWFRPGVLMIWKILGAAILFLGLVTLTLWAIIVIV